MKYEVRVKGTHNIGEISPTAPRITEEMVKPLVRSTEDPLKLVLPMRRRSSRLLNEAKVSLTSCGSAERSRTFGPSTTAGARCSEPMTA